MKRVGAWLMAWAEAILTGMLTATFVALRPERLLTGSDLRGLPRRPTDRDVTGGRD